MTPKDLRKSDGRASGQPVAEPSIPHRSARRVLYRNALVICLGSALLNLNMFEPTAIICCGVSETSRSRAMLGGKVGRASVVVLEAKI